MNIASTIAYHRHAVGTIAYLGGFLAPPDPFVWSFIQCIVFSQEALALKPGEFVHPARSQYGRNDWARNQLAREFLGDWLLMIDADMKFDPDIGARLLLRMMRDDLDVVTGLYCFKDRPDSPVLYKWNEATDTHEVVWQWPKEEDIFPVDSAGGGALLVRRKVFDRLREAFPNDGPFDRIGKHGEDHSFFRRLKMIGVQAWCAWRVQSGHLRYDPVTLDQETLDKQAAVARLNYYPWAPEGAKERTIEQWQQPQLPT